MASRTQIVCLCEGSKDIVFINRLMRALDPPWIRSQGSNRVRTFQCGGRTNLIKRFPEELQHCLRSGGSTTLMVWADCDDDCADGTELLEKFWQTAQDAGIKKEDFDQTVFIFAKDRIENWIQFLQTGSTDEGEEGPRVDGPTARSSAIRLAELCKSGKPTTGFPPSLSWSCNNWRELANRMKRD